MHVSPLSRLLVLRVHRLCISISAQSFVTRTIYRKDVCPFVTVLVSAISFHFGWECQPLQSDGTLSIESSPSRNCALCIFLAALFRTVPVSCSAHQSQYACDVLLIYSPALFPSRREASPEPMAGIDTCSSASSSCRPPFPRM